MKKILLVLIIIFITFSVSGCYNRREPKSLAIIQSVIYDKKGVNDYEVTLEYKNPAAETGTHIGSSSTKRPTLTSVSNGLSISEAIRNATNSIERNLFAGHNEIRFFSERFAKEDMISALDFYSRDNLADETPYLVVIKDPNPQMIFSGNIGFSNSVGTYLTDLSKIQPDNTSKSVFITSLNFIKEYYLDGKENVAGLVELVDCQNNEGEPILERTEIINDISNIACKIQYEGLAAFKNEHLVGFMDGLETRAYNLLTNNLENAFFTMINNKDVTVLKIENSKSKIKTSIKNNIVSIDIIINTHLVIIQESSGKDLSDEDVIKKIQNDFDNKIKKEILLTITKAQNEFKSDIFGFGELFHIKHPKEWKKIKKNWNDYFTNANINIKINSVIEETGKIKEPIRKEELNEQ